MHALWETLRWAFGVDSDPRSYTVLQVCLRAFLVYLVGLLIVRLGRNRLLGRQSAFDIILGFVLGSVLSRAINGTSRISIALVSSLILVATHRLFAILSFHSSRFGAIFKGEAHPVIRDGKIDWEQMRKEHVSERDLEEALRLRAKTADEKRVAEGIQTIRIEIQ